MGRDAGLSFFHCDKGDDYADCLGKRNSESGAGRSHVKQTDEQVIQGDIGDARHGDEVHRAFGIAHAPEYRADDVIRCDERNSDKADGEISDRARNGFSGVEMSATTDLTDKSRMAVSTPEKNRKRVAVLPTAFAAFSRSPEPIVCPMLTVLPIARPTRMTVSICMT